MFTALRPMPSYRIFLLHVWIETPDRLSVEASTRIMLEDPYSGQRWGFGDPSCLVPFLKSLLDTESYPKTTKAHTPPNRTHHNS